MVCLMDPPLTRHPHSVALCPSPPQSGAMQGASLLLRRHAALKRMTDRDEIETECDRHIGSFYRMIQRDW